MKLEHRNRDSSQEKKALKVFIEEGIRYFKYLLEKYGDLNSLKIHFMIHLGDLHRYKEEPREAEKYYEDSSKLDPDHGLCYNQIAVINQTEKLYLNSVYYYVRSMTVQSGKYPKGLGNLKRVFKEVKTAPVSNDKPIKFCSDMLNLVDNFVNGDTNNIYYELLSDFSQLLESKGVGEMLLIKINVILIFFSESNDKVFELLVCLNEKIADQIIRVTSDETKKKNVRFLAPIVIFLDYLVQNNSIERIEKFGIFLDKMETILKINSRLKGTLKGVTSYVKEQMNLRGCSLLKYQMEGIPYNMIKKNLANDEEATSLRLNRLSDFLAVTKVAKTLVDFDDQISVENINSDKPNPEVESKEAVEDQVDALNSMKGNDEEAFGEEDEEEDIIVFSPEPQRKVKSRAAPQAAALDRPFTLNNNEYDMPPMPPPGFAPIVCNGGASIISQNPFLSYSMDSMMHNDLNHFGKESRALDYFKVEKKVEEINEGDPLNVMGSIFGTSNNPFLD